MQQTEKYKLNLIESSDPFLPEGLNQNTQKVEDVLSENLGTMRTDLNAVMTNLGVHGKNARIAFGTYQGTDECGQAHPTTLNVGFYPVIALVGRADKFINHDHSLMIRDHTDALSCESRQERLVVAWTNDGVSFYNTKSHIWQGNASYYTYIYLILGYDL